jgi:hypothetical protein
MWRWAACLVVLSMGVMPRVCLAEDETPSIVGYGLQGFGTGIGVGLASGYIATGATFEKGEWRALVLGAGIGALTGMGVGIALGIIDASATPSRLGVGHYILQDMNYGVGLGALAGLTVGALIWATTTNGEGKDVLRGMAYGAVIGASAGLLLGIIEGALRKPAAAPATEPKLALQLGFAPGNGLLPVPYPVMVGRF